MKYIQVKGKNTKHDVTIFTLSTCGWCEKTKNLLKSLDVSYLYIDVDTLEGNEKDEVINEVKKFNTRGSYPTIVIDNGDSVIIGFKELEIKEALR